MSYLLTEIALEMLGYKFYDTNGDFHLTNFQQSMTAVKSDLHSDEPSLMDFIHQTSNTESESSLICGQSKDTYEPSSLDPSTKSLISSRTSANALSNILDYEITTIRGQISQRLEASLQKSVTSNKEVFHRHCCSVEKNRIIEDANGMKKFRLILEERLRRIDPRPYATYKRTFGLE
ncbi:hypothetical protein KR215_008253 [Drosophila sulfurigaster]|nr:hypothetical protein KR215_008253 [Drosophila sulfurigaster]